MEDEVCRQEWVDGHFLLQGLSLVEPSFGPQDNMSSPGKKKEWLTRPSPTRLKNHHALPEELNEKAYNLPAYAVAATFLMVSSSSASRPRAMFSNTWATKQGVACPSRYKNSQPRRVGYIIYKYHQLLSCIEWGFDHPTIELTPFDRIAFELGKRKPRWHITKRWQVVLESS